MRAKCLHIKTFFDTQHDLCIMRTSATAMSQLLYKKNLEQIHQLIDTNSDLDEVTEYMNDVSASLQKKLKMELYRYRYDHNTSINRYLK